MPLIFICVASFMVVLTGKKQFKKSEKDNFGTYRIKPIKYQSRHETQNATDPASHLSVHHLQAANLTEVTVLYSDFEFMCIIFKFSYDYTSEPYIHVDSTLTWGALLQLTFKFVTLMCRKMTPTFNLHNSFLVPSTQKKRPANLNLTCSRGF